MRNLFIVLVAVATTLSAQTKIEDKVIAVVGDEVILESDLVDAMQFLQAQTQLSPSELQNLKGNILDELIKEKLLLHEAKQDTSIHVTEEEVDQTLESQIKELQRSIGEEKLNEELKKEGMTLEEFKEKNRKNIRDQLYIQKLIEKRLKPKITVTPADVKAFYEEKKDSIPDRPPTVQLAHILVRVKPSKEKVKEAEDLVNKIYQRLLKGESFETLAMEYSDDPMTRDLGGDIGYLRIGDLPSPLRDTIAKLEPGEISNPYYDEAGFHIFRVDEKEDDLIRLRQILIAPVPTKDDSTRALTLAKGIHRRIEEGQPFEEMAQRYSDDPTSRDQGGLLGYIPIEQLPQPVKSVVDTMKPGQISTPIRTDAGFNIIKVLDKKSGGKPSFEEVQQELTVLLQQRKLQAEIDKLVEQLRQKIYVEIKEEE